MGDGSAKIMFIALKHTQIEFSWMFRPFMCECVFFWTTNPIRLLWKVDKIRNLVHIYLPMYVQTFWDNWRRAYF